MASLLNNNFRRILKVSNVSNIQLKHEQRSKRENKIRLLGRNGKIVIYGHETSSTILDFNPKL